MNESSYGTKPNPACRRMLGFAGLKTLFPDAAVEEGETGE